MKKLLLLAFSLIYGQYMIYGTTEAGYISNQLQYGTIFSYNPMTNKETVLFHFKGKKGEGPDGSMLYASDSLLYGITGGGGIQYGRCF